MDARCTTMSATGRYSSDNEVDFCNFWRMIKSSSIKFKQLIFILDFYNNFLSDVGQFFWPVSRNFSFVYI